MAAQWIYAHRNASIDWDWPVLTRHNDAGDCLNLPEVIAFQIWTIFAEKRMVLPKEFPCHKVTGKPFWAYELNFSEKEVWTKTRRLPTCFDIWIFFPLQKALHHFPLFVIWIMSLIITSGVTHFIEKWIDNHYARAEERQNAVGPKK